MRLDGRQSTRKTLKNAGKTSQSDRLLTPLSDLMQAKFEGDGAAQLLYEAIDDAQAEIERLFAERHTEDPIDAAPD